MNTIKLRDSTSPGSRMKMQSSVKSPTTKTGARIVAGQANFGFGYRGGATGMPTPGRGSGKSSFSKGTSTANASGGGGPGGAWRGGDGTPGEMS